MISYLLTLSTRQVAIAAEDHSLQVNWFYKNILKCHTIVKSITPIVMSVKALSHEANV